MNDQIFEMPEDYEPIKGGAMELVANPDSFLTNDHRAALSVAVSVGCTTLLRLGADISKAKAGNPDGQSMIQDADAYKIMAGVMRTVLASNKLKFGGDEQFGAILILMFFFIKNHRFELAHLLQNITGNGQGEHAKKCKEAAEAVVKADLAACETATVKDDALGGDNGITTITA